MTNDTIDTAPPHMPDQPSAKPQRVARALVGWMPLQEAIQYTLGRMPLSPVEEATAIAIAEPRRATAAARASTSVGNPVVQGTDRGQLDGVASRPALRETFGTQFSGVEWVDLTQIVSVQKLVFTDGIERVKSALRDGGPDALVELCLPLNPQLSEMGLSHDLDGRGTTLVSEDPNVRFQGVMLGDIDVSQGIGEPRLMKAVSLLIGKGSPYLSVARYQGRCYLQNGYHRAVALIQLGVTVVPAVMVDLQSYDELAAPGSGFFGHGIASAEAPPMLTDFWDDSVAVETSQPFTRKVLRMRCDEFGVSV